MSLNKTVCQRQLKVLGQILRISPNLEEMTGLDQGFVRELEKTGRWPLVKTLDILKPDLLNIRDDTFKILAKFAKAKPKLVEMKFDEIPTEFLGETQRKNLFALLKSSEETLENLELESEDAAHAENRNHLETPLRLVKLTNVSMETIKVLSWIVGTEKVVDTLPSLQNFIIDERVGEPDDELRNILGAHRVAAEDHNDEDDEDMIEIHPPNRVVQVKDLVFESVTAVELEYLPLNLAKMFPNVQTVKADLTDVVFYKVSNRVWRIPETVEILELTSFFLTGNANHGIDALLTGIPSAVCEDLKDLKKSELENLNPDDYRELPSVLNLPNLKLLRLNCVESHLRPSDFCNINGTHMSHLVRWGALDRLPDLRLLFRIPYINIRLTDLPQIARFLEPVKDIAAVSFYFDRLEL